MCKCASFIVLKHDVKWLPLSDSHEDIINEFKLYEGAGRVNFVRVEISPEGGNLSLPLSEWRYELDQTDLPDWYDDQNARNRTREALKSWAQCKLTGWNVKEAFNPVNPLKIKRKKMSRKRALGLVKEWASVRDLVRDSVRDSVWASVGDNVRESVWDSVGTSVGTSVRDSIRDSVWASVGDNVRESVWDSVGTSVGTSVRDSIWDSVWAYIGSLFVPRISTWKYAESLGSNTWKPLTELWYAGYLPSFDGTTWRLHAGEKAEIVFEFTSDEIKK